MQRELRTPVPSVDLDAFFARVRSAPARALLLDYDGTLAPFHVDPAQARPYAGVREALDALMAQRRTRLVLVSGRWTRDLLPLLGLAERPEIWGSHGRERLAANGDYALARIDKAALAQLVQADDLVDEIERLGARCERKPASLAFHWRGLVPNQVAEIRSALFANWRLHELHRHFAWRDFDGGVELCAPGRDKGFVVDAVLGEMPEGTVAAYLGDDETDEDAFRALKGRGLGVLVRAQFRPTAAECWLRPPAELLAFLRRWIEASGDETGTIR